MTICSHRRDDFGYPIDQNMCAACRITSNAMNDYHIECVLAGIDPERKRAFALEDEEAGA